MPPGSARIVDGNHTANIDCRTVLATAAIDERFGIDQGEGDRMQADDVRQMMKRITLIHDTSLDPYFPQTWPAAVKVITRDGLQREETVIGATGERERPVSVDQIKDKFEGLAAAVIGAGAVNQIADAILGGNDMKMRDLATLFAKP
jgi:2-methylcitrate dehydratase